jgi:hypothetical protein
MVLTEHLLRTENFTGIAKVMNLTDKPYQDHSYPLGTMIIVRDHRPKPQRKMFPLYN